MLLSAISSEELKRIAVENSIKTVKWTGYERLSDIEVPDEAVILGICGYNPFLNQAINVSILPCPKDLNNIPIQILFNGNVVITNCTRNDNKLILPSYLRLSGAIYVLYYI